MPRVRLTELSLKNMKRPERGQIDYWDANLSGFGVRVSYGGTKSFVVLVGQERKKIGQYPALKLKEARRKAAEVLHSDPVAEAKKESAVPYREAVDRYEPPPLKWSDSKYGY